MRHSKALIVALLGVVTLALMLLDQTHVTGDDAPIEAHSYKAGAAAPDVTFMLMDGKPLRLHSLKGKTVWLHFWASWCAPCRKEFGDLLERVKTKNDVVLLAVSGDAKREDAQKFLAPYRRDFSGLFENAKVLIAHDPKHALIEGVFQTFKYPETILIGPDLVMQDKITGIYSGN